MFKDFTKLYIKAKSWNNVMYRFDEIRRVVGLSMTETGRLCVDVEFADGERDSLAMIAEGKEWDYCDHRGNLVIRVE